jgi:antitoxin (DNA-binding transcriptional repressor) of toxin-antitoxin stability system
VKTSVREASRRFADVIKAVRAGQDVVLTERGKRIAVIKRWSVPEQEEEALRRMEAAGLLRRATRSGPLLRFRPIRIEGEPLSETIRKERDER